MRRQRLSSPSTATSLTTSNDLKVSTTSERSSQLAYDSGTDASEAMVGVMSTRFRA